MQPAYWKTLRTDADAKFDEEINFEADIEDNDYLRNLGMGFLKISNSKDVVEGEETYAKSLVIWDSTR
jgi:3-isopropylmalate/(R)-2-methylmalate dehydratase large subunit